MSLRPAPPIASLAAQAVASATAQHQAASMTKTPMVRMHFSRLLRGVSALSALLALVVLALAPAAHAAQTGELQGYIIDAEGVPVAGVRVTLSSPQLIGGPRRTTSGEGGDFRFSALEPGSYTVSLEHPRHLPLTERDIVVGIDAVVIRDYLLEPRVVGDSEAPQVVEVVASAPVVDTTSTSTATSVRPEMTDRLPTARSYQDMAAFAPGAVDSAAASGNYSIHGGTGYSNQYLLDGINITDPVTNTFSANFNFDAIAETQVLTGGFDAEYGYSTGGIINIVTKSGGDEFTLDGSIYWQPSQLQLLDPGELNDSNEINANLAVGGPILKQRLWFFLSGQYVDQAATTPLESQIFNDVATLPARTYRALYLLGKLKWQPTDWQRTTLLLQGDPTWITNELQDATVHPSAERQRFQGGVRIGLSSETVLTDELLWKTQVGYSASRLQIFPMSGDFSTPGHQNITSGHSTVNDYLDYDDWRYRLQLHSSLTYFLENFLGDHELKAGVEGALTWEDFYQSYAGGQLFRDQLGPNGEVVPYQVDIVTAPEDKLVWGNTVSLFMQDVWRPVRSLTIRPGVRFDSARTYNDEKDGGEEIFNLNWVSPRIGVAWDPFGDGKTVVRGGYFQYADMGMLLMPSFVGRGLGLRTMEYNPITQEYDIRVREIGGESAVVAKDNLVPPVMHEIIAGIEREVFPNAALSGHVIYRRKNNMWEDDEVNVIWNKDGSDAIGFYNGRPEYIFSVGTPDESFSQYVALELKFDKRLSDNWALLATYTLSRLEGTNDSLLTYALDNPRQAPYEHGFLEDDIRHNARVSASYELPLGIIIGATAIYRSGRPYNHYYLNQFYGDYLDRRARRGYDPGADLADPSDDKELRLPDQMFVNARFLWDLRQLTGQEIQLLADVFNLLNARPTTSVEERHINEGRDFGKPLTRASPLSAQLALRYRF